MTEPTLLACSTVAQPEPFVSCAAMQGGVVLRLAPRRTWDAVRQIRVSLRGSEAGYLGIFTGHESGHVRELVAVTTPDDAGQTRTFADGSAVGAAMPGGA
jgi:hypothetical protein